DRVTDGDAAEPERVVDAAGERRTRLARRQAVRVVELQDERDLPRELRRPGFEEAERRRVRVAARRERELEVRARIVPGRVGGKGPCRPMLEALIHRKDDQATGTAETAVVQQAREVGSRAGTVARIASENLADSLVHVRPSSSCLSVTPGRSDPARSRACR